MTIGHHHRLRSRGLIAGAAVAAGVAAVVTTATAAPTAHRTVHWACSGPNSAKVPCRFSTPSGNIRCLWTPKPNTVACVRFSTGRGFRLAPTGSAKPIKLKLTQRGDSLPPTQLLSFPDSLGCNATRTAMSCGQAYGLGMFKITARGSRHA